MVYKVAEKTHQLLMNTKTTSIQKGVNTLRLFSFRTFFTVLSDHNSQLFIVSILDCVNIFFLDASGNFEDIYTNHKTFW
jgi:hypothetical protein